MQILESNSEFWLEGSTFIATSEEDSCFTMQNNLVSPQNCSDKHFAVCRSRKSYAPTTSTTTIRSTITTTALPVKKILFLFEG